MDIKLANEQHTIFMRRALERAAQAAGHTSPNPAVGAVIVKDGEIIAEGFTQPPGKPHAEAEAIRKAGSAARGATLYATLEPCNHFGKTPPCTLAIIEAGITEVHFAVVDPNPRAAGGHQRLVDAGVKVYTGLLKNEAYEQNRFFFHHTKTNLPYVIAKFASSLDGKIATVTGESQWITGAAARQQGHELRQLCDGILIGSGTALGDNPSLTTRLPTDDGRIPSHPTRIVLNAKGNLPETLKLLNGELPGQTIVVVSDQIRTSERKRLTRLGVKIIEVSCLQNGQLDINALLQLLGQQGMHSLMVEGGGQVLGSFFAAKAVDEVWAFIAPKIIGGNDAPGPIGGVGISELQSALTLENMKVRQLDHDLWIRGNVAKVAPEKAAHRNACLQAL
ncbi:MAG: bifunctional diaminohydroxyphosphoribosylaminopyrimidine deaminase/5-amino-6-(5-phosphoribosylamino)uracil reductase RibD [Anaerolineae bacterium]